MTVLRPIAAAFGFLTRLPVGGRVDQADLGASLAWFPAVGAALGLVAAAAAWLLAGHTSAELAAALVVALLAAMTGGLHLDGVADVFDALGGGRGDRQRMLAILRDSRIGAHGAAALCLVLLAKVLATADLLRTGSLWPLALAPAVARWAVVPIILFVPYARPEGLGRAFHERGRPRHLVTATAVAAAVVAWSGPGALVPAACALAAAAAMAAWMRRRLGGATGDVYGAAVELAELAFLVAAGLAMP